MYKSKVYRYVTIMLSVLLVVIVGLTVAQAVFVTSFDNRQMVEASEGEQPKVYVDSPGVTSSTDVWETSLQMSEDAQNESGQEDYLGATCSLTVCNTQKFDIRDWQLKLKVSREFYLNGFWCGEIEVHQFRNGQELVERVNAQSFDVANITLDRYMYSNDLFIHLLPGDYLVYFPSEDAKETIVYGEKSIGIGIIVYFRDCFELSDYEISYYNNRRFTDGVLFRVLVGLGILWVGLSLVHAVSLITYRHTRQAVDSLTNTVINGLSLEYKTLWLIDVKKKGIQLIRNHDEKDVEEAMRVSKDFEDYDVAIKYYIDHYVVEKDREKVWNNIQFDALLENLSKENFYTVNYLHQVPETDTPIYFQMAFTRVSSKDGAERIVLAYRDIDRMVKEEQLKQKQLEEALAAAESANRSKTIFLANMSHEIRTPINAILGMDTMILRETGEDATREYAKDIKLASTTLLSIVNDILDFSKIESGKMDIVPGEYRLDEMLVDLMNMIKPRAEEKGLDFEIHVNPDIPSPLWGDEIRLKQIILNLLSNAVKYTRAGRIDWYVDYQVPEEGSCELSVKVADTGIGIRPEDMEQLCSPYARLEENVNRSVEGTGLGLSITKSLLEKMNSALQVESVYGEGSVFSFALRQEIRGEEVVGELKDRHESREEARETFHAPEARVLAVDDVDMNLIVIRNLLKRVRIAPDTCDCGADALRMAKERKYDLILLDAMMPEMNGEETLRRIRTESELNAETPIVVLTANAIMGAKESYLAAGFNDYLSKPVEGVKLEEVIGTYLPPELLIAPEDDITIENGLTAGEGVNDGNLVAEQAQLDEAAALRTAMEHCPGITLEEGIRAAGDFATYRMVCNSFCDTAPLRMEMFRESYAKDDFENYSIQAHTLKSSSRLIGALGLAEHALELELAGKEGNVALIREKNDALMAEYNYFYEEVKKALASCEKTTDTEKPELSDKKLKRNLSELLELVQAYDFESAKELFGSLEEYRLPEHFTDTYAVLKNRMAEVDYQGLESVLSEYLEG